MCKVFFIFVFLANISLVEMRICKFVHNDELCKMRCCGMEGDLSCRSSCVGVTCSQDDDCDEECCSNEECHSCTNKKITTGIVSAVLCVIVFICIVLSRACLCRHRTTQPGTVLVNFSPQSRSGTVDDDANPLVAQHYQKQQEEEIASERYGRSSATTF